MLVSIPGKGREKYVRTNNKSEVIAPNIIVVPILRNVEETIAGIISKIENGLRIPPVRNKRAVSCIKS